MLKRKVFSKAVAMLLSMLLAIGVIASTALPASAATTGSLTIYKLEDKGLTSAEVNAIAKDEIDGGNYSGKAAAYIAEFYYAKTVGSTTTYHKYLSGATYAIYKIGTMDQSAPTASNPTVNMVYTPISGLKDKAGNSITVLDSDTDADNIDISSLKAVASATTGADGKIAFSGLDGDTVYLVIETNAPAGVSKANNFIVTVPYYDATDGWINNITAYPKNAQNDATISKKTISGTVSDQDGKETASLGNTIGYKVSATVPSDIDTAGYTQFDIVDTPSAYLTIDSASVKVYLNGTDVSNLLVKNTDYVLDDSSGKLTIKFVDSSLSTNLTALLDGGDKIFITYNAKIAASVPSDVNTITNDIQIQYKTDGGSGTIDPDPDPGVPDGPEPVIYLYSYSLKKVNDSSTPSPLAGATFAMYKLDGDGTTKLYLTYDTTDGWGTSTNISGAYKITSGSDGLVQFIGLAYGKYYITETAAPAGYTLLNKDIEVTIDGTTTAAYINEADDGSGNMVPQYNGFSITVVNTKATGNLPTTGGNGIYLFLIIGGALIVAAVVLYAKFRKKITRNNNVYN